MTDARNEAEIGIIGGTGIYNPELLQDAKEIEISTPFGKPSDLITIGIFENRKIAFIPRHGRKHTIPPHKINYRANIWAMKELGVKGIIAPAAVGSLREELKPGDIVVPNQFIDKTHGRDASFYDGGKICHISVADPFCPELSETIFNSGRKLGLVIHKNGTCVVIQGPRFSTRAESNLFRSWGADIINMTIVPECVLAREAQICYATFATITDYDAFTDKAVSLTDVVSVLKGNSEKTQKLFREIIPNIPKESKCCCKNALKDALL